MAILEPDDRDVVRQYLAQKLTVPVRMVLFSYNEDDPVVSGLQTGASSRQAQELVEEIASLSDAITLEIYDIVEHQDLAEEWKILAAPTIAFGPASDGTPPRVRFVGFPGGHEFTSFLETLGSVGRENWGLSAETVELLSQVERKIDLKTFVTPNCVYCPKAVITAHRMALANPGIVSSCIESDEMAVLAGRYQVMMVPKMVVNEQYDFSGALPEVPFVTQVLQGSLTT
jgi:glutaredoxin-like protein